MDYHSAIKKKKKKTVKYFYTHSNLGESPEKSQCWKVICSMIPFKYHSWNDIIKMENRIKKGATWERCGCCYKKSTWGILMMETFCILAIDVNILVEIWCHSFESYYLLGKWGNDTWEPLSYFSQHWIYKYLKICKFN